MKQFKHEPTGRQRFMGYSTNDKDVSIIFYGTDKIQGEIPHFHQDSNEVYLTTNGQGAIWINGKVYRMRPGQPIKVEKGEPHMVLSVIRGPLEYYVIKTPDTSDDRIQIETPAELTDLLKKHNI